jgi:hypothetical protein
MAAGLVVMIVSPALRRTRKKAFQEEH